MTQHHMIGFDPLASLDDRINYYLNVMLFSGEGTDTYKAACQAIHLIMEATNKSLLKYLVEEGPVQDLTIVQEMRMEYLISLGLAVYVIVERGEETGAAATLKGYDIYRYETY